MERRRDQKGDSDHVTFDKCCVFEECVYEKVSEYQLSERHTFSKQKKIIQIIKYFAMRNMRLYVH